MSYATPITDRTYSDIALKTSKGYFNAEDWQRIKTNSRMTRNLAEILLSISVSSSTIADVTTASIPTVTEFNALLAIIENLRLGVAGESIAGTETEIKDDYAAGLSGTSPTWEDANLWESTIDAIWVYLAGSAYSVCLSLTGNLTVTNGNQLIVFDCIDANNYEISLEGDAALYII